MLKGKRTKRTAQQIPSELDFDAEIDSKQEAEARLATAIGDQFDGDLDDESPEYWAEKYASYTPGGYSGFEVSRNYDRDFFEALKTHKWTDLADCHSYSFVGFDPFGTANTRDMFADYSDLDHFKVAVSRYIQAVTDDFTTPYEERGDEIQALHYIIRYWQRRATRKAVEDGEVLR